MNSSNDSAIKSSDGGHVLAAMDAMLQPLDVAGGPGLAIGVARGGNGIYERAFGLASVEHNVASTLRTRWRIGSTTKHFTCLAILLLAEDGLLSIDEPIDLFIPELPTLSSVPTLRQLMNHTGGWRDHLALSSLAHGLAIQPRGSAMPLLARQLELNFEPGSQMIYSNGGYLLLSQVIERVSGRSLGDFLTNRIFAPMEMRDTAVVTSDFEICPGMASGYLALPGQPLRRGINFSEDMAGDGAVVSTIPDMLVWLAHLRARSKRIGSEYSWAQMLSTTRLTSGVEVGYGLGLMRHEYRGVEVVHHAGGTIGSAAQMITVPEHELDIVILANGAPVSPVALAFAAIDAVLADVLPRSPERRAATSDHESLPGNRYHSMKTGLLVGFADVGGQLGLSWLGSPAMPLRTGAGSLSLETHDTALSPISIDTQQLEGVDAPDVLRLSEGGQMRSLLKVPATPPDTLAIAPALVGEYICHDLAALISIEVIDNRLILAIQGEYGRQLVEATALLPSVLEVTPLDPTLRLIGERGVINLERDSAARVTSFRIDIGRIRHLKVVRVDGQSAAAQARERERVDSR